MKVEIDQLRQELIQLSNVKKLLEEGEEKNKELQALLQEANTKAQKSENQEKQLY